MKAKVGTRVFEDRSWNGLVSRIVAAYNLNTSSGERTSAARWLEDGEDVLLGNSVTVKPVSG